MLNDQFEILISMSTSTIIKKIQQKFQNEIESSSTAIRKNYLQKKFTNSLIKSEYYAEVIKNFRESIERYQQENNIEDIYQIVSIPVAASIMNNSTLNVLHTIDNSKEKFLESKSTALDNIMQECASENKIFTAFSAVANCYIKNIDKIYKSKESLNSISDHAVRELYGLIENIDFEKFLGSVNLKLMIENRLIELYGVQNCYQYRTIEIAGFRFYTFDNLDQVNQFKRMHDFDGKTLWLIDNRQEIDTLHQHRKVSSHVARLEDSRSATAHHQSYSIG